jgi:phosphoribosyl 1,2-cyclic phosphodiesterase
VKVTLWGTRGSLASPGPETVRYGGNTSCVEVRAEDDSVLVLDAGTGIRRLGIALADAVGRLDILLTHLHMDHIQGLGFFDPLFCSELDVHIWGPPSTTEHLRQRLARYLSPPLFPVQLPDLCCQLQMHDVTREDRFTIGPFEIEAALVCHPGATVGYRISADGATLCYLPDHEPALGCPNFPREAEWTSGYQLARDVDLLIHDAQFTDEEYPSFVGWGHSALTHTLAFAAAAGVRRLVPFHHDPAHTDGDLDDLYEEILRSQALPFELLPGMEGATYKLGSG